MHHVKPIADAGGVIEVDPERDLIVLCPNCNANTGPDECDIASGASEDLNANSIPDDCECLADIDNDTFVTVTDLLLLLATWGPCPPVGDCFGDIDFDGTVAVPDLLRLLAAWGTCQ